ncbi:G patch domain-containing protein 8 [Linnemannia schmuckeri]|uniref:G patch domain-containing protein 8 n=1 Tax=Linnemannia schmuckeri TaxID=64567 RepID=A0A9P5V457_9FUNG|nr:G patch domain-containing protein 8 [Linnemannia schmuckeri]
MQQLPPEQQQQQLQRFYRQELKELASTRDAIRAKSRPNDGSDSDSYDDDENDTGSRRSSHRDYDFDEDGDIAMDDYDGAYGVEAADMETHIPESNVGYKLLLKMGWKAGTGLGANASGRSTPIPIERKQDSLGIGRQALDIWWADSTTAKRKTLEAERQAEETEAEKSKRELQVQQNEAIQAELTMVKSAFYCALCDKQYERISDYEVHLSSYDHNHKKRFKEMKDTSRAGAAQTTSKIKEKERKREERELAKMQEAAMKRAGGSGGTISQQPLVTPSGINTNSKSSFQSVQASAFQPVQSSGFQPVSNATATTPVSTTQPISASTGPPGTGVGTGSAGFLPVKLGGFQPVKSSGFQPVKASGFQPVKLGGFQSMDDDDEEEAKSAATQPQGAPGSATLGDSGASSNSAPAPGPSGFQPVKIGGFKPMKIGGFQLKKPGTK